MREPERERQQDQLGQPEAELEAERAGLGEGEAVEPGGEVLGVALARPAGGGVEAVAEGPQHGPVDEVQRVGDAAEPLVGGGLEEALEPGEARDGGDEEGRRPEEEEPLVVEDGLGLEEGEVVPAADLADLGDLVVVRGHAAQVDADDEQVVEDELLEGLEAGEEAGQVVRLGEQVEVAQQHAGREHGEVGAVGDVHEVEDEADLAAQAGVARGARQGEQGRVDDERAAELDGDGPHVQVVAEPRVVAHGEDEAEVLELGVPLPQLGAVVGRLLDRRDPEAEDVPRRHVQPGREDDGQVQADPAPEQGRAQVLRQLEVLAGVDEAHGLRRQDVAGDDEEDGDGVVAAREEGAHAGEGREVVQAVEAKAALEDDVGADAIAGPQLVVVQVDEEGRESPQPVEVRGAAEGLPARGGAPAQERGPRELLPEAPRARRDRQSGIQLRGLPVSLLQHAVVGRGRRHLGGRRRKERLTSTRRSR